MVRVRRLVNKFLPPKPKRALLLIFDHPIVGRCVLHHPDEQHMVLGKGDGSLTATRFYLKPYFKYLTNIDLHHYRQSGFVVGGVEYDVVWFEFPVVCNHERALGKLSRDRHQFIPLEQHRFADKVKKIIGGN